jgi:hypothetical protein
VPSYVVETYLAPRPIEAPSGREAALVAQRAGLDPIRVAEARQ